MRNSIHGVVGYIRYVVETGQFGAAASSLQINRCVVVYIHPFRLLLRVFINALES